MRCKNKTAGNIRSYVIYTVGQAIEPIILLNICLNSGTVFQLNNIISNPE